MRAVARCWAATMGAGLLLAATLARPAAAQPDDPSAEVEPEPAAETDPTGEEPAEGEGGGDAEGEGEAEEPAPGDGEPTGEAPAEGEGEAEEPAAGDVAPGEASPAGARGDQGSAEPSAEAADPDEAVGEHQGRFAFGTYGRVIAATDGTGRPGRDMDIVAHGSRLDLSNYAELELRREDRWAAVDADTRMVATLAFGHPIFHYDGEFDAALAIRNLYLEEKGLGLEGLGVWAGSRMLRGDDIYLLDFWPLDNLNTLGGGLRYDICGEPEAPAPPEPRDEGDDEERGAETEDGSAPPPGLPPWCTAVSAHVGMGRPTNPFYEQLASRPAPLNQFGAATVAVLDRQRWVVSLRGEQVVRFGGTAGLKLVAYGEIHSVPRAQRETSVADVYEPVPSDGGFVVGGQVGGFLGDRGSFLNLFVRYASGLAAYGEFATPEGLALDRSATGAHELTIATSGNWEIGPVALSLGGYFRSFRNANEELDFGDVDEGIIIFRPHLFYIDWAGVALEGSYQVQHRGVLTGDLDEEWTTLSPEPLVANVGRIGVMPFIAPAGPGAYSRPWIYLAYVASFRNQGARMLYPTGDAFRMREVDHYVGLGAEWWFGSTSYGGQ